MAQAVLVNLNSEVVRDYLQFVCGLTLGKDKNCIAFATNYAATKE
jgi:hypothetical protein